MPSHHQSDLKSLTNALSQLWNQYKKQGQHREGVDALDSKLKPLIKVGSIHAILSKIYREAGQAFLKQKDYSRAKKMAAKMKKLGRKVKNSKYGSMAKQLESQIKRAREKK